MLDDHFRVACPPGEGDAERELPDDLAARLAAILTRARAEWPEVVLDDRAFIAALAQCIGEERDIVATLDKLHVTDLYLARACIAGEPRALEILEKRILPDVAIALRTVDRAPAFADEVLQLLRQKLLVDETGDGARLARYLGTGPLGGWIRVVALRLALDLRRQTWRETPLEDDLLGAADPAPDPERALVKERHSELLREALRHAVLAQSSNTRALLRFYYGDGVGLEELAELYHVHASTVSRRLAKARDSLLELTRQRLSETLKITDTEVDSLVGHGDSIEMSLNGLLKSSG